LPKLKFRCGNGKTFSNGTFPKSKVWLWNEIRSKVRTFGYFSYPNCLLGKRLGILVSRKTSPSALFPMWYDRWTPSSRIAPCACLQPPRLVGCRALSPHSPHTAPCTLDNGRHVWRAGRLTPQPERAALARGWDGTRPNFSRWRAPPLSSSRAPQSAPTRIPPCLGGFLSRSSCEMSAVRASQNAYGMTNPTSTRGVGTERAPHLTGNAGQVKLRRPVFGCTLSIAGSLSQS
jgi:hypothetical protein